MKIENNGYWAYSFFLGFCISVNNKKEFEVTRIIGNERVWTNVLRKTIAKKLQIMHYWVGQNKEKFYTLS